MLRLLDRALGAVATLAFVGMLGCALAQVLFRYVLHWSIDWTEEGARVLFLIAVLLGIALAVREREHIAVPFLLDRLPRRLKALARMLIAALTLLFLAMLGWGALLMAGGTWHSYLITIDWLSLGYLYAVEVAAIAITVGYVVLELGASVRAFAAARGEGGI